MNTQIKTPNQIAREVAERIDKHGAVRFMGGAAYTPNDFRTEIAEAAILADRAQRQPEIDAAHALLAEWDAATPQNGYNDVGRYALALLMGDALRALLEGSSVNDDLRLFCAECGKTGPGTYDVTILDPEDYTTRTELCRDCDNELRKP